jgi:hypothetical protein
LVRIDEFGNAFVIEENNPLNILDTLNSSNDSPRGSSSLESNASSSTNSIEPLPRPPPLPPLPKNFTRSFASNLSTETFSTVNSQLNNHNLVFSNPNQYEYDFNVINKQDDLGIARSANEDSIFSNQQTSILINRDSNQTTSFRSYTNFDEHSLTLHEERALIDFSNSQVLFTSI